jgi:hypothetical protein
MDSVYAPSHDSSVAGAPEDEVTSAMIDAGVELFYDLRVANIISLERVTEDAIADAIATAILRANVSPETVDVAGANSVHSSSRSRSVRTGGDLRGRKGFFDRLFHRSKPSATPSMHVYNAGELGRLLMLNLESE